MPILGRKENYSTALCTHIPNTVIQYMVNTQICTDENAPEHHGCSQQCGISASSTGIYTVFMTADFHIQLLNPNHETSLRLLPLEQK